MVDIVSSSQEVIGHGAFSIVYKAKLKKNPSQTVAIKAITKKNLAKSRNLLGTEIVILKKLTELNHENVVALIDYKETPNHIYLVMEYCNGGDLADYLLEKGTLSESTIILFLIQIAGAMQAMVSKNIVHRDLKPQNILLSNDGKSKTPSPQDIRLKIADFGFARFLDDGVMAGTLCGSPMYMAPEVIMSCKYDSKADLWSIGTIVFQCLTGRAPFQRQTPQALKYYYEKNARLAPKIPEGTSPQLADLLLGLLKRDSADRMDFDTFFHHRFIRPQNNIKRKTSSMSIPSLELEEDSGGSMLPPSPINAEITSPPQQQNSAFDAATLLDSEHNVCRVNNKKRKDSVEDEGSKSPSVDDFVIVPANLAMDSADQHSRNRAPTVSSKPKKNLARAASSPLTEPIPVPSQKAAYQHIQQCIVRSRTKSGDSLSSASGGSNLGPLPEDGVVSEPNKNTSKETCPTQEKRTRKVSTGSVADIRQMSPPTVQFTMGTPPLGHRRRTSSSSSTGGPGTCTPPQQHPWTTPTSSPIRKSPSGNISGLPPILGSPVASINQENLTVDNAPRVQENIATAVAVIGSNDTSVRRRSSDIIGRNVVLNYGNGNLYPSFHRSSSLMNLTRRSSFNSCNKENNSPGDFFPDGYPVLPPPDLSEDTLLSPEHTEILNKLRFISVLTDTIIDVARGKAAPLSALTESVVTRNYSETNNNNNSNNNYNKAWLDSNLPHHRRLQQLLLYMRCLQHISITLDFSKSELTSKKLKPSTSVKNILATLNERFRHCLSMTRMLNSENLLSECGLDSQTTEITADRLLYSHAIEQCQAAALDELFGNPEECFQRYQGAHVLLHALQFQTQSDEEKFCLNRYKDAVEKRLHILEEQGFIQAYTTSI
ncbi:serine/threonine-protein kinase unc-51 isoform X2 [Lepeophtheirus salmonis]|uniref:Serine/threonineprotein kinase ULK2like [Bombus terrestris] n=1 Tax=Lepeophtheirus salmonis TaxID=72036 RepID=A0A0K2THD0_LEPSM|nr:serine/threonine-protein kinase unc-51-like isoform X2 [Lepeophtheirus salmonis]